MARLLELSNGPSKATIAPHLGAAVAGFWATTGGRDTVPVLRSMNAPQGEVFDVGMNLLAPFSNRIAGGGFRFGETDRQDFHEVEPNLPGEPLPIHGDAFLKMWTVTGHDTADARLVLNDGRIGPFRYRAEVDYALGRHHLDCTLRITNRGPTLPFGGGFHPWFPRHPGTRLTFAAEAVWLEDHDHLPTELREMAAAPAFDFSTRRELPDEWINNAFIGWKGTATIDQPDLGIRVHIGAGPGLGTAIVYSPSRAADFFCFEPVSHAVNSHNQPGMPGLQVLRQGETLSFNMQIGWSETGGEP